MPFSCSICEEESTRICASCTKDTCSNHLCDRCGRCSDCCDCEVKLEERPTVHEAGLSSRHTHLVNDARGEGIDDEPLTDPLNHTGEL